MGVAGLWEVLRPAGKVRSLTELAVHDGFNANPSCQRGFRIGIDASIWFFHAAYGREGENPELRTLFFRCCRLLQSPLLPLFVFDGPSRPAIKRGKRVGGNQHWLTEGMKNIIDAFGFEWWVAPGEAEAELAYLNRIGVIDAVLSDDVDNFLFGAVMVIRNPSNTLSGNRAHPVKNAQGKDDGNHVVTYKADIILSDPSVTLSRSGTILIGLLSGGDYIPAGLPGCGQKFATGLARAGFGDSLIKAVKKHKGSTLDAFLDEWRQQLRNELKTNKSGLLPSKKPSLAASLPDDFPSLPVLMSYAEPITSENTPSKGKRKTLSHVWRNDPDPMKIAALCELYFEWGVKDVIVQRFRTVLWPGIVCRAVRRVVMNEETHQDAMCHQDSEEEGENTRPSSLTKQVSSALSALALSSPSKKSKSKSKPTAPTASNSDSFTLSSLVSLTSTSPSSSCSGTASSIRSASSPLLLEVVSQRTHVSTNSILEYRVLVNPTALVERAESGVKGLRPPLVGGLFGIDTEDEDGDDDEGPGADESEDDPAIERLETAASAASKSGKKKRKARREEPTTLLRLWLPACMVCVAAPALVEAYEEKVRVREEKKAKRGTKGGRGGRAGKATGDSSTSRQTKTKDIVSEGGNESESVPGPSGSKMVGASKSRSKVRKVGGGGGGRRRVKQASEAQDDGYECIDLSAGESACSDSDGEVVETNSKGRGKAKTGATKPKTKTNGTATGTMNNFYKTTKSSSGGRVTKSKWSKTSASNPTKPIYEEEEESTDVAAPPPLPKSSRPLDLLRSKTKSGATASNTTSKSSKVVPRYEEEESSSSSASGSKTNIPARPVTQTRKKPLFVNVSDTDSDVEVRDVRGSLYCATKNVGGGTSGRGPGDDDASSNVGTGGYLPPRTTKSAFKMVDGVIDLTAKRSASNSDPSTSAPTHPLSPVLPTDMITDGVSPMNSDTVLCTPTTRLASKLARIFLPQAEEEEEGSEGDELPTFHRGSSTKMTSSVIARPPPRPFPMQLGSDSTVFPCASGLGGREGDEEDDSVEILDVFTTPRSPLPPRSPSPLPVKRLPVATAVKSKPPNNFPDNLTESESQMDAERQARTRQRRQVSPDSDTHASGNEGILKSPRKSAEHSSPRHVRTREYASSPTRSPPPAYDTLQASRTSDDALEARRDTWDGRERRAEGSRLSPTSGGVRRKPRPSDVSTIYISSGSEDEGEGDIGLGDDNDNGGNNAEVLRDQDQDPDGYTDLEGDGWADTAMILSVPPSPARATPHDPVSHISIPPHPARASKFKPAHVAPKTNVRAASAELELEASGGGSASASLAKDTAISVPRPQPVHCAPLLVARAKRCVSQKGKGEDVIDLTSD